MPGYFTIIDKVQSDGFDTEDLKIDTLSKHGLKPIKGFKCIFTSLMIGFACCSDQSASGYILVFYPISQDTGSGRLGT